LKNGQKVFMKQCYACHPGGEAGFAPGLNDKPLPGFLIKFQVRHGLGAMPAFSPDDIGDDDLDHLVQYLKALRRHSG
jgi:mono/diheme cytochrome c family protein